MSKNSLKFREIVNVQEVLEPNTNNNNKVINQDRSKHNNKNVKKKKKWWRPFLIVTTRNTKKSTTTTTTTALKTPSQQQLQRQHNDIIQRHMHVMSSQQRSVVTQDMEDLVNTWNDSPWTSSQKKKGNVTKKEELTPHAIMKLFQHEDDDNEQHHQQETSNVTHANNLTNSNSYSYMALDGQTPTNHQTVLEEEDDTISQVLRTCTKKKSGKKLPEFVKEMDKWSAVKGSTMQSIQKSSHPFPMSTVPTSHSTRDVRKLNFDDEPPQRHVLSPTTLAEMYRNNPTNLLPPSSSQDDDKEELYHWIEPSFSHQQPNNEDDDEEEKNESVMTNDKILVDTSKSVVDKSLTQEEWNGVEEEWKDDYIPANMTTTMILDTTVASNEEAFLQDETATLLNSHDDSDDAFLNRTLSDEPRPSLDTTTAPEEKEKETEESPPSPVDSFSLHYDLTSSSMEYSSQDVSMTPQQVFVFENQHYKIPLSKQAMKNGTFLFQNNYIIHNPSNLLNTNEKLKRITIQESQHRLLQTKTSDGVEMPPKQQQHQQQQELIHPKPLITKPSLPARIQHQEAIDRILQWKQKQKNGGKLNQQSATKIQFVSNTKTRNDEVNNVNDLVDEIQASIKSMTMDDVQEGKKTPKKSILRPTKYLATVSDGDNLNVNGEDDSLQQEASTLDLTQHYEPTAITPMKTASPYLRFRRAQRQFDNRRDVKQGNGRSTLKTSSLQHTTTTSPTNSTSTNDDEVTSYAFHNMTDNNVNDTNVAVVHPTEDNTSYTRHIMTGNANDTNVAVVHDNEDDEEEIVEEVSILLVEEEEDDEVYEEELFDSHVDYYPDQSMLNNDDSLWNDNADTTTPLNNRSTLEELHKTSSSTGALMGTKRRQNAIDFFDITPPKYFYKDYNHTPSYVSNNPVDYLESLDLASSFLHEVQEEMERFDSLTKSMSMEQEDMSHHDIIREEDQIYDASRYCEEMISQIREDDEVSEYYRPSIGAVSTTSSSVDDIFSKLVHKNQLQHDDNYDESPRQFPMNLRNELDQEVARDEETVSHYTQDDQKENMMNHYHDDDGTTTTATGGGATKLAFYYSPSGTNSLLSNSTTQHSPKLTHSEKASVNPREQTILSGGLCLSPTTRTPMQARKWRTLAAQAAEKDKNKKSSTSINKKKKKNPKKLKRQGLSHHSSRSNIICPS